MENESKGEAARPPPVRLWALGQGEESASSRWTRTPPEAGRLGLVAVSAAVGRAVEGRAKTTRGDGWPPPLGAARPGVVQRCGVMSLTTSVFFLLPHHRSMGLFFLWLGAHREGSQAQYRLHRGCG